VVKRVEGRLLAPGMGGQPSWRRRQHRRAHNPPHTARI